ncbi:MAG: CAP domain-containing protein [Actinomycetota bacterium]
MRHFPDAPVTRSVRRSAVAALVVVVLVSLVPQARATTSAEKAVHAMINTTRAAEDRRTLSLSGRLSRIAHRHSKEMASRRALFHSCLACSIGGGWRKLGENVGYGPDIATVQAELMASPPHRANLLDRKYRRVGVGVVRRGALVWVTQIFYA